MEGGQKEVPADKDVDLDSRDGAETAETAPQSRSAESSTYGTPSSRRSSSRPTYSRSDTDETALSELLWERGGEGSSMTPDKGILKERPEDGIEEEEEEDDLAECGEDAKLMAITEEGLKELEAKKAKQNKGSKLDDPSDKKRRRDCNIILTFAAYLAGFAAMAVYSVLVMSLSPHLDGQHTIFPVFLHIIGVGMTICTKLYWDFSPMIGPLEGMHIIIRSRLWLFPGVLGKSMLKRRRRSEVEREHRKKQWALMENAKAADSNYIPDNRRPHVVVLELERAAQKSKVTATLQLCDRDRAIGKLLPQAKGP